MGNSNEGEQMRLLSAVWKSVIATVGLKSKSVAQASCECGVTVLIGQQHKNTTIVSIEVLILASIGQFVRWHDDLTMKARKKRTKYRDKQRVGTASLSIQTLLCTVR